VPEGRSICKWECQGGESNSRPRAYESPALPLSYPGEIGGDKGQSHDLCCQRERVADLRLLLFLILMRFLSQLTMQERDKGPQKQITALAQKDTALNPSRVPGAPP
jgi:hypothetical protein